ncbi:VOC family protein [Paenibacillus abyssi]|uniref:VOC domain-containing protein n=1 Tax=Paenibacillus abyssi TaxID=1340531 RepID=A0A917FZ56_9BACL|nr:VOC family protein [Paenibacillus abyssi]GGG14877.1 hypothetical protein GCM10010916_34730 [Paenibacillus abyssi]
MNLYDEKIDAYALVQLPVRNLKESVAFYTEQLGFVLENPGRDYEVNCFLRIHNGNGEDGRGAGPGLHLLQTEEQEFRPSHWIIDGEQVHALELHSKNIVALHEKLKANNVTVVAEPYFMPPAGGYLKFLDPSGHLICVNQAEEYV